MAQSRFDWTTVITVVLLYYDIGSSTAFLAQKQVPDSYREGESPSQPFLGSSCNAPRLRDEPESSCEGDYREGLNNGERIFTREK